MEILTDIQETALRVISQQVDSEAFYLTGGTALSAFYLNHRKSLDLDFFTSVAELITPFSLNIEAALKAKGLFVERRRGFHSFVELIVRTPDDSTQIHLAADSPFRFEQPAHTTTPPKRATCVAYFNMINGAALISGALLGSVIVRLDAAFMSGYLLVFLLSGLVRLGASLVFLPRLREVRTVETIGYSRLFLKVVSSMPAEGLVYGLIPFRRRGRKD